MPQRADIWEVVILCFICLKGYTINNTFIGKYNTRTARKNHYTFLKPLNETNMAV